VNTSGHMRCMRVPRRGPARWQGLAGLGACVFVLGASLPAPGHAIALRWDPPVEIAVGDAYRGPWRMNDSDFRYVDDPTVAVDETGGVGVAWVDQSEQDIYFQYFAADGEQRFEEPVNVSRSGDTFSWLPRLILTGKNGGEIGVLWQEIVFSGGSHGGEIFFARSGDGGESFTQPVNLSRSPAGAGKGRLHPRFWHNGSLDLARGPEGELYAAWTEYEGALRFSRSTDGGRSFSDPVLIAGGEAELPARGPSLAVSADGRIYLAWSVGEDPRADIHLARSTDGGESFSDPRRIVAGPGHADAPKVVISRGHLHLVYAESPAGPLQRYEVRHARARLTDSETPDFHPPQTIAGGEGRDHAAFPYLAADGNGTLYVLWERFPERSSRPRGLGYAVSGDGGQNFSAPKTLPGSDGPALGFNGSLQGLLMQKLAVDPAGRVAIANSTYAEGEASRIWLFRGQRRASE
jgi:hypothetical protein